MKNHMSFGYSKADIEALMNDKGAFDAFVYTPWREALEELDVRKGDRVLQAYAAESIGPLVSRLPAIPIMALFRHIATPNYETVRFVQCADVFRSLAPVIFEYQHDRFADINTAKHALGRLCFHHGLNRRKEPMVTCRTIIDMARCNSKRLSELTTLWGTPFVDFHHDLLLTHYPLFTDSMIDISVWLRGLSESASGYYKDFLSLFLTHGILFENFLHTEEEAPFTRDIILPAIMEIGQATGKKPLIINLGPSDSEADPFWNSYPPAYQDAVDKLLYPAPAALLS